MATRRQPTEEERAVGQRLRRIRERQGLKYWQVALDLGMEPSNYALYEQGRNRLSFSQVADFARVLRVTPHELAAVMYPDDWSLDRLPKAGRPDPRLSDNAGAYIPQWTPVSA